MSFSPEAARRLILPFDYEDGIRSPEAQTVFEGLRGSGIAAKVGTVTAASEGWFVPIDDSLEAGYEVFADTKALDVMNTVESTLNKIMDRNPLLVNMHARGSHKTMEAFVKMAKTKRAEISARGEEAKLITLGVTLLTDITDEQCRAQYGRSRNEEVLTRALELVQYGFDGFVCSAEDLEILNSNADTANKEKVVPAIRPLWSVADGQQNIVTPKIAIERGATRLVCGSPITKQYKNVGETQMDAAEAVVNEIAEAL